MTDRPQRPAQRRQLLDANEKFLRSVSALLTDLDDKSQQLSEKAQGRVQRLRETLAEQQDVMRPRLQKTMERLEEQQRDVQAKATRAITGRDDLSLDEWLERYEVVKLKDKVTYVSGVAFMLTTQYIAIRFPEYFRFFFAFAAVTLIGLRFWMYQRQKMLGFLGDYCYVVNTLCVINAVVAPNNAAFWQVSFVAANGPLLWAIVAWRNSLVFWDLDKITSIYIHFVPALLTYTTRWNLGDASGSGGPMCGSSGSSSRGCSMTVTTAFLAPLAVYALWQIVYLIVTELVLRQFFEDNPTVMTSLRWIVRDRKNSTHQLMLQLGRQLKLLKRDEPLDLQERPLVPVGLFVTLQLAFTLATFLPAAILFRSQMLHRLALLFVGGVALWNGAGFMFHVFVVRYEESLRKRDAQVASSSKRKSGSKKRDSQRSSEKRSSEKRSSRRISDANKKPGNKGFCAPPNARQQEELQAEREREGGEGARRRSGGARRVVTSDTDEDADDAPLVRLPSI